MIKGDYELDIYGPIEDPCYWKMCPKISSNDLNQKVRYIGTVNNSDIAEIYPRYDLFFFPTLGENFGHVIYESLALGVPVLCSDKILWDKLEEFNAGWSYNLSRRNLFIARLNSLINSDESEYSLYREGAKKYARFILNDEENIKANLTLFDF